MATSRAAYYRAYRANLSPERRKKLYAYPARERAAVVSAKRREFLNRWKTAAGCIDCGYNTNPVALDFDHVNSEKSFTIGMGVNLKWARLIDEIAKCVVRCANCHRIKTLSTPATIC